MIHQSAFVFPGQGSQSVGMLAELAEEYSIITQTFQTASEVLGYDLWQLCQTGTAEKLSQTEITQPALLTASYAIWQVITANTDERPAFLAGHSLGEYSALTCSGVIDFKDAVSLVEKRGQLMQTAVPKGQGAMAAIIGLTDAEVIEVCSQVSDGVVEAVNFNSPGQVVIAGSKAAVELACGLCKEAGAKRALPLPVSTPSHCALMKPAAEQLGLALQAIDFNKPNIAVINNVDVKAEIEPEAIKHALVRQLFSPVRWTETVNYLASHNVTTMVECGAGKVLAGLIKRIDKSLAGITTCEPAGMKQLLNLNQG